MDKAKLLSLTADIVCAHASANGMNQENLILEIGQVFSKLASLAGVEGISEIVVGGEVAPEEPKPAVPLEAAFGADKVFCMVCGQGMKTLRRHLSVSHGLKPGQYRRQFGIPAGTALVAKNYSESRKAMAKKLNLAERLEKARAARVANRAAAEKATKKGKSAKKPTAAKKASAKA